MPPLVELDDPIWMPRELTHRHFGMRTEFDMRIRQDCMAEEVFGNLKKGGRFALDPSRLQKFIGIRQWHRGSHCQMPDEELYDFLLLSLFHFRCHAQFSGKNRRTKNHSRGDQTREANDNSQK